MNRSIALGIALNLALSQFAHAEEQRCISLSSGAGDPLVDLSTTVATDDLLRIRFAESQACIVPRASADIENAASSSFRMNNELAELAVQATVDGLAIWLRIDSDFGEELLLDRTTGDALGLLDAEFLGDNSLLEASDFFVEFVSSLEIGSYSLRNVEASIPHLEVPYDHYAGRDLAAAGQTALTVGSIGEELLENLTLTLDFGNDRIYINEAN